MRIELFGNQALVSSVSIDASPIGFNLLINTSESWMSYHRQGGSIQYHANPDNMPFSLSHECILLGDSNENDTACEIVLIAESEYDVKVLRGMAYFSQDDNQVSAIYVDHQYLNSLNQICEWRNDRCEHGNSI